VSISVSPSPASIGATATLTWSASNATSCIASGAWSGTQGTSGTLAIQLTSAGTATYTLVCQNAAGTTATGSASLIVVSLPIISISVSPSSISYGASALLTWSATNATTCSASGAWSGMQPTAGTMTVSPTSAGTGNYTLVCKNAAATPAIENAVLTITPLVHAGP